ncbi:MAG: LPS-assembly protein LptD [Deltaproteobacteria bacterium]|nr:MAG: LPS-assembly protein LptD [Deltaproteobacteria bacterium]
MRGGMGRWACVLALALSVTPVGADASGGEVQVLSGTDAASAVTVRARPEVRIEDRTPGAKPPTGPRGPASTGQTFTDEVLLFLRDFSVPRAAAIDVGDSLVSTVRLSPEVGGTLVSVFVRQPVTYTVSRPSAIGDVRIELRGRSRPLTVVTGPRGQPRVTRPKQVGEGEIAVDAESLSYDQEANTLTARGGVTLKRGDTTLTADEVVYDRTRGIAEASGHVVLTDPQATMEGDFAHLNLDDESGWFDNATADLQPSGYTVRGTRIEKQGGPLYSVARGVFTTCRCGGLEGPSWSIAGAQTDVKVQGWGLVQSATFRVKDVPVFWLPYLPFPAGTNRESGFLMPRLGYSNRRGFQYEQPFFWAISKSTDATVAVDVETAARVGLLGEYRYFLSRQAHGSFGGAYYNEQIRGTSQGTVTTTGEPANIPENRFVITGHHIQPFYWKSRFYLDLFAVSDDQLLREVDTFAISTRQDVTLRSTRFTTSQTGVIKSWSTGLARVETVYHQDLIDPQDLTLQKLPRVEAEHAKAFLDDHLVGGVSGETVDYQREDGYDGLRADFGPSLFLPFHLGRTLNGSLSGGLRETAYHLTDREQVAFVVPDDPNIARHFATAPQQPRLDTDRTQEVAEVRGRTGTEFDRVFDFRHLGLEKVKHTIEPEMRYFFVPAVGRPIFDTRLPACSTLAARGQRTQPGSNCDATLFSEGYLFDERDAVNQRNFFSYGVTSRLLGRGASTAEIAAREEEGVAGEEVGPSASGPVDPDILPQGLSANALPTFVGPPAPPGGAAPAVPAARELARASILHGYDVSRELVGASHQSDVDLGLRVTPLDYLGLSYNTTVSLADSVVRGLSVGGFVREPWWQATPGTRSFQSPSTLGISYRFIEKNVNQGVGPDSGDSRLLASNGVNELDGSLYLRLGDYLGFTYLSRYDLGTTPTTGPHFLERDYLLRIISRCNCWLVEAGVADKTNPDERLFRVQLTLVGLGSFGRSPQNRNYVGFNPLAGLGFRTPASSATGGLY